MLLFIGRVINYLLKLQENYVYSSLRNKYNIPQDFRFNGVGIRIYGLGKLLIAKNSYIGSYSSLQLHEKAQIFIGKGCSISHNVKMYTSSKMADYDFENKSSVPEKIGDITIGDFCWIGANVFINPGIKIGENSIIGANSVVTKDIEPFSICGGVPCKLIRKKNIND